MCAVFLNPTVNAVICRTLRVPRIDGTFQLYVVQADCILMLPSRAGLQPVCIDSALI